MAATTLYPCRVDRHTCPTAGLAHLGSLQDSVFELCFLFGCILGMYVMGLPPGGAGS